MFIRRTILASLTLLVLVGNVAAAPIYRDGNELELELVARAPTVKLQHFNHAKQIMRDIGRKFKPKANESAFWSGTKNAKGAGKPVSVKSEANHLAKVNGQKTINHALTQARIRIPPLSKNPYSTRLWNFASKVWAKKAHGETHAYLGSNVRPGSVYKQIEKPGLLKNEKVTKLTEHNLQTGGKKVAKG